MVFGDKGSFEEWKDNNFWKSITMEQIKKDLRRLDIEIQQELDKLRQLGEKEDRLTQRAKGKSQIEKRDIAQEVIMLRKQSKCHETQLMNLYNQRTTFKQIELYKTMEREAQTGGVPESLRREPRPPHRFHHRSRRHHHRKIGVLEDDAKGHL